MKCPKCGSENHPDVCFCAHCGEPLTAEPPTPLESIEVHIEGGVSGQVAIGNNILQIGNVYGGVVNVAMPEQKPRPRPRPTPVSLRPRPFPGLLDREAEVGAATTALQFATPVEFYGQAGLGKTTLLRHLAHHPAADTFPAGVVYLSARRQPVEDLLQSLFDAFYESDVPFKPTGAEVRHALQSKRALVILDDVDLARDEVEALMDTAPACTFLLAAPERCLWGEGRAVGLRGLPPDNALALVERELGRAVTPQEQTAAQSLCTALDCHPLRILQAAALAREEGLTLAEVARRVQTSSPDEALTAQVLAPLPAPEQRVLAALAALGDAPLHAEHLSVLTGIADVTPVLQTLQNRGLVQAHSPRYSLTGALGQDLQRAWNLTPWAERALAHFTAWAEEQQTPDRLLEDADAVLRTLEWAVEAERWKDVLRLGRAVEGALALGGRWAAWAQVLQWVLQAARAPGNQAAEAWALHQLGTRALCLGDTVAARTSLTQALRMREALGDQAGAAVTRHNLDIFFGPPAPPQEPPQPPSTLAPASGVPLLVKGIVVLASVLVLALGGWGIWHFWPRPTPTLPSVTEIPVMVILTPRITPSPTPDVEGPEAPLPLAPGPGAEILCERGEEEHQLQLQWATVSDPSGIRGYEIYLEALERDPRVYPLQSSGTSFLEIPLPCGEVYHWRVRAVDGAGNAGAWSEERVFYVIEADTTGPPAPTLLEPREGAEISCPTGEPVNVTLRWEPVADPSGIARYDVELVEYPYYPFRLTTSTLQIEVSQSQATISSECGDRYDWRVRAVDGAGNVGEWSGSWHFRVLTLSESDREPPPVPDTVGPGSDNPESPANLYPCDQVVLRWEVVSDPSGIQGYRVNLQQYVYTTGQWESIEPYFIVYETSVDVTEWLSIGWKYRWEVWAIDNAGNHGDPSPWLYFACPLG